MLESQMSWNFTYKQSEAEELDLIDQLLRNRGLTEANAIKQFLNPQLASIHQPELLAGLVESKQRIEQAIEQGESILVFGDYDADGVTATTILVEALNELGAMCDYYIPNRFTEGYGPNSEAFRQAKNQGFSLIITVDTGIAAFEAAETAKELGLDLIITDHHEVQEELPVAHAIVHPKVSDDYPFKELAGVGVAFKLAHFLLGYFPTQFLDLVAIGTIADLVPLIDENRILVKHGLDHLSKTDRPGLRALKEVASINGEVDEQHVGFAIAPRLNAVGRLESAYPAVQLLLTRDPEEAQSLATEINLINQERQEIVSQIAEEAITIVEQTKDINHSVIIVAKEGWNEGVLGIVASKLVRTYQRPAICLTLKPDEGIAKGSGRSIAAFDLFENGMEIHEQMIRFGGHAQAIGLTTEIDQVDQLRRSFNQLASQKLKPEDFKEQLEVELSLNIEQLSLETVNQINQLSPFGMANPKPYFHLTGQPQELKQIGAKKNHLKFALEQDNQKLSSIAFGLGDYLPRISPNDELEVVGELQINEWNGTRSLQLLVKDLQVKDRQLFDYRGSKFWHNQLQHLNDQDYLCLSFQKQLLETNLKVTPLDQLDLENLEQVTDLVLIDLPNELNELSQILSKIKPNNIYTCYNLDGQKDWTAFPSRDDFKWFYGFLMKRKKYNHQLEQKQVANYRGWSHEKIEFILNVFYELKFVKIDNEVFSLNDSVEKRQLTESNFYQKGLRQKEKQDLLYYSNYQQLKTWLMEQIEQDARVKEEEVDGL